jgi:hypothetical protein
LSGERRERGEEENEKGGTGRGEHSIAYCKAAYMAA